MKRVFLFVGIVALFAVSCSNGKTDSAVADEAAQDSMKIESLEAEKESVMSLMGEIRSNLIESNGLENIVTYQEFKSESP